MALGRQSSAQRSMHLTPLKGTEPREGVFCSCCEAHRHLSSDKTVCRLRMVVLVGSTTRCGVWKVCSSPVPSGVRSRRATEKLGHRLAETRPMPGTLGRLRPADHRWGSWLAMGRRLETVVPRWQLQCECSICAWGSNSPGACCHDVPSSDGGSERTASGTTTSAKPACSRR